MSYDEVIEKIKAEFEFSQCWDKARIREGTDEALANLDKNKPVESWILWMEEYLHDARNKASKSRDKTEALHDVRKVANLAIACLVYRGCPDTPTKPAAK